MSIAPGVISAFRLTKAITAIDIRSCCSRRRSISPSWLQRLSRQGPMDLGRCAGPRLGNVNSSRDTGFGIATAGYNAHLTVR